MTIEQSQKFFNSVIKSYNLTDHRLELEKDEFHYVIWEPEFRLQHFNGESENGELQFFNWTARKTKFSTGRINVNESHITIIIK